MLEDILLVFKTFLCLLSVLHIPVDMGWILWYKRVWPYLTLSLIRCHSSLRHCLNVLFHADYLISV